MSALAFAWRSLVRQPARASLGILGVAAVGALLFDMLLLSHGLILSMSDLLDRTGWDVRVSLNADGPGRGRSGRIHPVSQALAEIAAIPSVRSATAVRFADARIEGADGRSAFVFLQGVSRSDSLPWTVLRGHDAAADDELVVNESLTTAIGAEPGAAVTVRASCQGESDALPPVTVRVAGVAEFPFQETGEHTAAGPLAALSRACAGNAEDEAHVMLVTSTGDAATAAAAIRARRPDLVAVTNDDVIGRVQQSGFTYFRQISTVLTTVTLSFAVLLITVLLTVSVNQRLGEIAALRALGFSRWRMAADVLSESLLIVGVGGLLSLPIGFALATLLDRILKGMPGIPEALHFFVFDPGALVVHGALMAGTALVAAIYPVRIVARLPIAATLRSEVIG